MRSLFVLSLPRSYSTDTFQHARRTLQLRQPIWTMDGEILNNDRSVLYLGDRREAGLKYTTHAAAEQFAQVTAFLDEIVRPEGFIYKDVVQPFVVAAWLAGQPELAVLKILPDPVHVVGAVLAQRWSFPVNAADAGGGPLRRLVEGILRAEQAILSAPGEAVAFDALIRDETALHAALQRLYPEIEVPSPNYVTPAFRAYREVVLGRRRGPLYRIIGKLVTAIRMEQAATLKPDVLSNLLGGDAPGLLVPAEECPASGGVEREPKNRRRK